MKYQFSTIRAGEPIALMLYNGSVHMRMDATIRQMLRDDIAAITLDIPTKQILRFDNIDIDVIYYARNGLPYLWRRSRIVYFKGRYILQVKGEGMRFNRRCTYRVGVSQAARLITSDGTEQATTVRDVSLTGFSITDNSSEVLFKEKDKARLVFEDLGHEIVLTGSVIRIERRGTRTVYGFTLISSSRDLPSYIAFKERRKRHNLPLSYTAESKKGGKHEGRVSGIRAAKPSRAARSQRH